MMLIIKIYIFCFFRLSLCDLAGVERPWKAENSKERFKEATDNNISLLAYESKLTVYIINIFFRLLFLHYYETFIRL